MKDHFEIIHYLIAMLKKYEISTIVASPGTQNARFNSLVQNDNYFKCISVIDERSAAYTASGLAYELNKPVVITCTGATASRNYMSAMTEAYYRKIPVIALTFLDCQGNRYNLAPQFLDRSVSPNDVKYASVELPEIHSQDDIKNAIAMINAVLLKAVYKKMPVHINCPTTLKINANSEPLPEDVWRSEYYTDNFTDLKNILRTKNAAIFIGAHNKFDKETENIISEFVKSYNMPVFCDTTSNYKGENRIPMSPVSCMIRLKKKPEIMIDIGGITGEYSSYVLFAHSENWRIAPDGDFKFRSSRPVSKMFDCTEKYFFSQLINDSETKNEYFSYVKEMYDNIQIPNLPLSNILISQNLAKYIPDNSVLHVAILNSLRSMNFFDLKNTVTSSCNVGGFGIDGPVSTLFGQALANPNKKCFGLIGDLAFFYDMNVLGNRHIPTNMRIILVNNSRGEEFRLNPIIDTPMGDNADTLIAAGGHNIGSAKGWAESCGFEYIFSDNKEDFLSKISDFCNNDTDKPILFEIKVTDKDEKNALNLMKNYNRNDLEEHVLNLYHGVKNILK